MHPIEMYMFVCVVDKCICLNRAAFLQIQIQGSLLSKLIRKFEEYRSIYIHKSVSCCLNIVEVGGAKCFAYNIKSSISSCLCFW